MVDVDDDTKATTPVLATDSAPALVPTPVAPPPTRAQLVASLLAAVETLGSMMERYPADGGATGFERYVQIPEAIRAQIEYLRTIQVCHDELEE